MDKSALRRLLREPLLHFIVIGGLLFFVYSAVNEPVPELNDKLIAIGPERIERVRNAYRAVWKKPPTAKELEKLVENEIRDEVYYRDALALGLDKGDTVVRKRLRQKLEFLSDTIYLQTPSDKQLEAFYQTHKSNYQRDPRLAFEQVYLGENPPSETVEQGLKLLLEDTLATSLDMSVQTLLPAQLRLSRPLAINNIFGPGFFEQLAKLAPGTWGGPITSAYGTHLVRTLDGEPARTPAMKDIRETVLKDWQSIQLAEARKQDYARRLSAYDIEIQRTASP